MLPACIFRIMPFSFDILFFFLCYRVQPSLLLQFASTGLLQYCLFNGQLN